MNEFPYALVTLDGSSAYCIGTYAYCARYALAHGIRATTIIVEF
jgi:hypothetical protein